MNGTRKAIWLLGHQFSMAGRVDLAWDLRDLAGRADLSNEEAASQALAIIGYRGEDREWRGKGITAGEAIELVRRLSSQTQGAAILSASGQAGLEGV